MFKYTVSYTDYNGDERQKDVYFNISMPELMKIERSVPGGYSSYLDRITSEKNPGDIWNAFVDIVDLGYGEKSPDGERFIKVDENGNRLVDKFKETPVFEEFMYQVLTNTNLASDMVNAMLPQKMLNNISNNIPNNIPNNMA